MSSQNNIYPKSCTYGCDTSIYWNTTENTYFQVLTQKGELYAVELDALLAIVPDVFKTMGYRVGGPVF